MWICDRCETYNNDDDVYCYICKTKRGNRVCQEPIHSVASVFVEDSNTEKADMVFSELSKPISAPSYEKNASEKVMKDALELKGAEAREVKSKPPLKVYEPVKKSSAEILEYYSELKPKRFRLYYYLRRILRYSLIAANIVAFCQILYCVYYICRIEGLI